MKFRLSKSSIFNTEEEKQQYEGLGFIFKPTIPRDLARPEEKWRDVTFDSGKSPTIEIENLTELLEFRDKWGVIKIDWDWDGWYSIEIADDY